METKDIAHLYPGNLYVVAAPSGAGKSSLVNALLELDAKVAASVSHTTRMPRGQEQNAREYHFVTGQEFDDLIAADAFVEWANVHGERYGTSKLALEDALRQGSDVVLEIDYQGALRIKSIFSEAVLIFILPPSIDELRARLVRRGEDKPEVVELRLANAAQEMVHAKKFDYLIINEVFERALFDLKAIVHAQRLKYPALCKSRAQVFQSLQLI